MIIFSDINLPSLLLYAMLFYLGNTLNFARIMPCQLPPHRPHHSEFTTPDHIVLTCQPIALPNLHLDGKACLVPSQLSGI